MATKKKKTPAKAKASKAKEAPRVPDGIHSGDEYARALNYLVNASRSGLTTSECVTDGVHAVVLVFRGKQEAELALSIAATVSE